jgi:hypothetical protein
MGKIAQLSGRKNIHAFKVISIFFIRFRNWKNKGTFNIEVDGQNNRKQ